MDENVELRNLPAGVISNLSNLLDDKVWKKVMAAVPSYPNDLSSPPLFRFDHIQLIEKEGEKNNRSCGEIFINEWGTIGKLRPTVKTLLNILLKLELYRAANFITVDLLKRAPISLPHHDDEEIDNARVMHIPFSLLTKLTDNWDDTSLSYVGEKQTVGHELGSGAFGTVYYGIMPDGTEVAIKKLKEDTLAFFNQFKNEIMTLSTYRHKNLVPLLGYSNDSLHYCIVYEFMPNRSLEDCLLASTSRSLSWTNRLTIAIGVCEGVNYLHTYRTPPLIHRDIKTANILLDSNMEARIGDFGLVKTSPIDSRMTSTIFGTSPYMAPEAFRGDISVKTDVFSVGVVLLELLTALSPYDETREGADLVTYVEETVEGDIAPLLDPKADWEIAIAEAVFEVALECIADKKKRPIMNSVTDKLQRLLQGWKDGLRFNSYEANAVSSQC